MSPSFPERNRVHNPNSGQLKKGPSPLLWRSWLDGGRDEGIEELINVKCQTGRQAAIQ